MKQISLILKTDLGSIEYNIDADARKYAVNTFDADGKPTSENGAVEIVDPQELSKRLYQIVHAALLEQT